MTDARLKILTWEQAEAKTRELRRQGRKIVFTNGCFDLIHVGHVRYLTDAKALGDFLIVGLNSDRSVKEIKGPQRPVTPQDERAEVMAALAMVDMVVIFDQPDPLEIITKLLPDVLVKGGDWPLDQVIGRDVVEQHGGQTLTIPVTENASTTKIIELIRKL